MGIGTKTGTDRPDMISHDEWLCTPDEELYQINKCDHCNMKDPDICENCKYADNNEDLNNESED